VTGITQVKRGVLKSAPEPSGVLKKTLPRELREGVSAALREFQSFSATILEERDPAPAAMRRGIRSDDRTETPQVYVFCSFFFAAGKRTLLSISR
jgi:hypothetical protein